MASARPYNAKSPTVKRILKEAAELANSPSADYEAHPVDDKDIFEWHFTLRGPPEPSPYARGFYHGRIVLPHAYPLRPPSFRFMTPSGRFEPNREICLTISGHHEESWQPAWGIRTALIAIRSFMDSRAAGQLGGVDANEETRKYLAEESRRWRCHACGGRTCEEMMKTREEEAAAAGVSEQAETVPDELRLGYRDELEKSKATATGGGDTNLAAGSTDQSSSIPANEAALPVSAPSVATQASLPPTRTTEALETAQQTQVQPNRRQTARQVTRPTPAPRRTPGTHRLDLAIALVAVLLGILLIRKVLI